MKTDSLSAWAIAVLLPLAWTAHAGPPVHSTAAAVPARPLNLDAPALSRMYSRAQLRYILNQPDADVVDVQDVSVQGEHYVAVPMGQLQAIPWAILHPTQAWRIFTPVISP